MTELLEKVQTQAKDLLTQIPEGEVFVNWEKVK